MTVPAHLQGVKAPVAQDKLDELREIADKYAQIEEDIASTEKKLEDLKADRLLIQSKTLPDLFGQAGTDNIGLPERGIDVQLKPYYKASIPAEWEVEKQELAFEHLDQHGHGGVIRSVVTVSFPKEELERARAFCKMVRESNEFGGLDPILTMSVPWNTLTSLVKTEHEKSIEGGKPFPMDLTIINAIIGRIAKIKKRK